MAAAQHGSDYEANKKSSLLAEAQKESYDTVVQQSVGKQEPKPAGFVELCKLVRDRMLVDFLFRGSISGAFAHLSFYLVYTLGFINNGFRIFLSELVLLFMRNIVWGLGALFFYTSSQAFLGKNHKPWQFYLLFKGKKDWNWRLFKDHIIRSLPSVALQFVILLLLFPPYVVMLTAVFSALYAPFVFIQATTEEVMDRNVMLKMMEGYGFRSAGSYVVLSSLSFALVHFVGLVSYTFYAPTQALVYFATFGVVMAINAYYTQGIEVSSVDHTLHNLMLDTFLIASTFAVSSAKFLLTGLSLRGEILLMVARMFLLPYSTVRHFIFRRDASTFNEFTEEGISTTQQKSISGSDAKLVTLNALSGFLPGYVTLALFSVFMSNIYNDFQSLPLMPKLKGADTLAGNAVVSSSFAKGKSDSAPHQGERGYISDEVSAQSDCLEKGGSNASLKGNKSASLEITFELNRF